MIGTARMHEKYLLNLEKTLNLVLDSENRTILREMASWERIINMENVYKKCTAWLRQAVQRLIGRGRRTRTLNKGFGDRRKHNI